MRNAHDDGRSRSHDAAEATTHVRRATPDWVAQVIERGLAHAGESGFEVVGLEVDRADDVLREVLVGHGFTIEEEGRVETWLAADARPRISPLHEGYRLSSRLDTIQRPHHLRARNGADVEGRLAETSLYRPDLDLVVHDSSDSVAAYGLFWYDPATATGLVEPMRTEDDHQRRGLARHILTTGVDLLAEAGASASRSAMNQTTRRRNISTSAPASSPIGRPRSSQVRQAEECL